MTLILHACPKCGGTLSPEEEFKGEIEYVCINCGMTVYLRERDVKVKRTNYNSDPRDGRQSSPRV